MVKRGDDRAFADRGVKCFPTDMIVLRSPSCQHSRLHSSEGQRPDLREVRSARVMGMSWHVMAPCLPQLAFEINFGVPSCPVPVPQVLRCCKLRAFSIFCWVQFVAGTRQERGGSQGALRFMPSTQVDYVSRACPRALWWCHKGSMCWGRAAERGHVPQCGDPTLTPPCPHKTAPQQQPCSFPVP